jgi:hypothetical protein
LALIVRRQSITSISFASAGVGLPPRYSTDIRVIQPDIAIAKLGHD